MFRTREEILLPRRITVSDVVLIMAYSSSVMLTFYYSILMKKSETSGFLPCFGVFLWNNALFSEIRLIPPRYGNFMIRMV
jgi:hypothetical protein